MTWWKIIQILLSICRFYNRHFPELFESHFNTVYLLKFWYYTQICHWHGSIISIYPNDEWNLLKYQLVYKTMYIIIIYPYHFVFRVSFCTYIHCNFSFIWKSWFVLSNSHNYTCICRGKKNPNYNLVNLKRTFTKKLIELEICKRINLRKHACDFKTDFLVNSKLLCLLETLMNNNSHH